MIAVMPSHPTTQPMPARNRAGFLIATAAATRFLAGPARAATKIVQVGPGGSLTFSPATTTVAPGDTVEWHWMSGTHTTTRAQGPETWDSGVASTPHTFSHTFTQSGRFPYVCTIHQALGMTGTIVVSAGSSTTTVTTPGTTSTTNGGSLSCVGMSACQTALMAALPTATTAQNAKERKLAHMLDHLGRRAVHQLDRVAATSGTQRNHAIAKSRHTLERLRTLADTASTKGTLVVPVAPIDAAIASLLTLEPAPESVAPKPPKSRPPTSPPPMSPYSM